MGKKRKAQNNLDSNEEKKGKTKTINDNVEVDDDLDTDNNINISTSEQPIRNIRETSGSRKPKKIIFVDDEPHEVQVTTSNCKKIRSKAEPKIQQQLDDILKEEDVKDEDIDKFCDELNEEDNKQYENWVQLIEANLNSNKKKAKYLF